MEKKLRLSKIVIPEKTENYYFVTFTSGEHDTEEITERHDIDIEVLVEESVSLADVEDVAEKRAIKFLKTLAKNI